MNTPKAMAALGAVLNSIADNASVYHDGRLAVRVRMPDGRPFETTDEARKRKKAERRRKKENRRAQKRR